MNTMPTILIVEKQAFSRFLIRRELEKLGFSVFAARSKWEAADILGGNPTPDFLVLGDLKRTRNGAYRIIRLPNARANNQRSRLAGHVIAPDLASPTTASRIAEEIVATIESCSLSLRVGELPSVDGPSPLRLVGENAA
jgi:CheY-like chemotaxis protein